MEKIISPIKQAYSDDVAYRNFVANEYKRRLVEEQKSTDLKRHWLHHALWDHKLLVGLTIILLLLFVSFSLATLFSLLSFIVLLFMAAISTTYKRKLGIPLGGPELVTFGTVITAVAYGPIAGLIFGLISSTAAEVMSANIGPLTWIYIFTLGGVGFLSGVFSGAGIFILGVIATIFTLIINQVIYLFIGDAEVKSMTALYMAVNLLFNTIIFSTIGTRVLDIIII